MMVSFSDKESVCCTLFHFQHFLPAARLHGWTVSGQNSSEHILVRQVLHDMIVYHFEGVRLIFCILTFK